MIEYGVQKLGANGSPSEYSSKSSGDGWEECGHVYWGRHGDFSL